MTAIPRSCELALACAVLLAVSCARDESGPPPSEVIVEIDADATLTASAASLRVVVEGAASFERTDELITRLDETLESVELPKRVAIVPRNGDASRVFVLTATLLDGAGEALAQARVASGFVADEVRYARLSIVGDTCLQVACEDALETCASGRCTSAIVDAETLSRDRESPTELSFGEPPPGLDAGEDGGDGMDDGGDVDSSVDGVETDAAGEDAAQESGTAESGVSECPGGALATCGAGATACTSIPGGYRCTCGRPAVNGGTYATNADGRGCHLRAWGLPVPVEAIASAAESPVLAADGPDTVVAAWMQQDGPGNNNVFTAHFTPSGGWGAPEPLEEGTGDADSPVLAANASGDVFAAWLELQFDGSGGSRYNPLVRARSRSGAWGAAQPVVAELTGTTRFARRLSAAVDSRGAAFVAWTQFNEVWVSQCEAGGTCSQGTALARENVGETPLFALAVTDHVAAILWRTIVTPQSLFLSTYSPATSWSTPTPVPLSDSATEPTIEEVALTLDAAGNANAVWEQGPQLWSVRYARSTNVWGSHRFHGSDGLLAIASDGGPNVIALTNRTDTSGGSTLGLHAVRYRTGSDSWDLPTPLPIVEPNACSAAINHSGNAVAVCRVSEGGSNVLRAASSASGGTWSEPVLLMSSGSPYEFAVVIDEEGNATVAWEQGADIWAARFE